MSLILFILIGLVCVAVCVFFFFQKDGKNPQSASSPYRHTRTAPKEIPGWLEGCLEEYEKQVLAYSLYQTSLHDDLSPAALDVQQKLGMNVYIRPALLLFDARTKAGCSDVEMEEYLRLYYEKKTGRNMDISIDAVYTVQEMLIQMAQDKVKSLQGKS